MLNVLPKPHSSACKCMTLGVQVSMQQKGICNRMTATERHLIWIQKRTERETLIIPEAQRQFRSILTLTVPPVASLNLLNWSKVVQAAEFHLQRCSENIQVDKRAQFRRFCGVSPWTFNNALLQHLLSLSDWCLTTLLLWKVYYCLHLIKRETEALIKGVICLESHRARVEELRLYMSSLDVLGCPTHFSSLSCSCSPLQ